MLEFPSAFPLGFNFTFVQDETKRKITQQVEAAGCIFEIIRVWSAELRQIGIVNFKLSYVAYRASSH